jgi:type IV pilus assembly protein PilB
LLVGGEKVQKKRLGEMLVAENIISEEQLQEALKLQKPLGLKLGEVLEQQGLITEEKVIEVLQKQLGIQFVDLDGVQINEDIIKMIPEEMATKYDVIPIEVVNGKMLLAMKDPLDYFAIEDIRMSLGLKVVPVISLRQKLEGTIKKYYGKSVAEKAVNDFVKQNNIVVRDKDKEAIIEEQNAPIMKFINTVIENAVRNKASDIHIEPEENDLRIRYRVDGTLIESMRTNIEIAESIISRIKIMSNLDITEHRIPQDGRSITTVDGKRVDLRISILPVSDGEKVVIRILDKTNFVFNKQQLGFSDVEMNAFTDMLKKPHGIIIITGPTGSGKTTTLYTMLSEINNSQKNIITIEDPIEYKFKGVNQVQVNSKVGLTFTSGLRAVLRQDPDVIMLGEIRDNETAQISFRSALTGHLVLSTLHTNDSIGAVTRLIDMGIEPFLISSTLVGVISQRLIKKICPHCKKAYESGNTEKKILNVPIENQLTLYKGEGCSYCNQTGYKDRIAVFEFLSIDREYREAIEEYKNYSSLETLAISKGFKRLHDAGSQKALEGITTIEEVIKLTYL